MNFPDRLYSRDEYEAAVERGRIDAIWQSDRRYRSGLLRGMIGAGITAVLAVATALFLFEPDVPLC